MISTPFAYDGWHFVGFAAGEIRNPQRNVPAGILLGVLIVIAVYVSAKRRLHLRAGPAADRRIEPRARGRHAGPDRPRRRRLHYAGDSLLDLFRELSPKDFRETATVALANTSSEALRQLKDKILQALDEEEREQSGKADDNVCFMVIHPKEVRAEHSYTLLVYAHLWAVAHLIEADARRFSDATSETTGTAREVRLT